MLLNSDCVMGWAGIRMELRCSSTVRVRLRVRVKIRCQEGLGSGRARVWENLKQSVRKRATRRCQEIESCSCNMLKHFA